MKHESLGNILLSMGAIDELQLRAALAHQKKWGTRLGRIVVDHQFCRAQDVLAALCEQTGLVGVDLDREALDESLVRLVPLKVAEHERVIPLRLEGKRQEILVIAIAAPASLSTLDTVRQVSGKRVVPLLADDEAIDRGIRRMYLGERVALPIERHVSPLSELTFDMDGTRAVLLFGWSDAAARAIQKLLEERGLSATQATAGDVLQCRADDVIVSTVGAMNALSAVRLPSRGRVIVISDQPERDLPVAQLLGARGLVPAPLDADLLARAVGRCRSLQLNAAAA